MYERYSVSFLAESAYVKMIVYFVKEKKTKNKIDTFIRQVSMGEKGGVTCSKRPPDGIQTRIGCICSRCPKHSVTCAPIFFICYSEQFSITSTQGEQLDNENKGIYFYSMLHVFITH